MGFDDWQVTVGVVSGGHLLSHFYILSLPPLFPLLRADFGLNNTQLGLLVSAVSLATLLQAPVGELVDRIGAKRVFVGGVALTGAGIMLLGMAPSYLVMLGLALVTGLGQSTFHPADYALLGAATDAEHEGKSFSVHTFGGFAGFAAAPLVVGTIGLARGWRTALLVVGAAGIVYAAFAWLTLEDAYRDRETADDEGAAELGVLLRPGILVMFAFFVALTMAGKGVQSFTPILAVEKGLTESIGNTALTVYFTAAAGGVLVGGVLADRYSPRRIIVGTLGVAAAVMWTTVGGVVVLDATAIVVAFSVIGFSSGLAFPSRDRLVSALSTAGSTGKSFGFVFTGISLGGLISPTLLGATIDLTTVTLAFLLVGAFYLAAAAIALAIGTSAGSPSARPAESS